MADCYAQLDRLFNLLPGFRELRKLELWTTSLEGLDIEGGSSESAKWLMNKLHSQKLGVSFDVVTICVEETRWGPNYKYHSRVNDQGVYVQWEEQVKER